MKLINQKYSNDCCIAALAMLAGITYNQAAKIIKPNCNIFDISLALNNLNIDLIPKNPKEINSLGLLVVNKDNLFHTVVYYNERIYDPDLSKLTKLSAYKVVLSFEVIKND